MGMKAVHLSDTHGTFPPLGKEAEIVFHSGDFCPNFFRNGSNRFEEEDQRLWLRRKAFKIAHWLNGRQMYVCQGNHDFTNLTVGHHIHDITYKTVEIGGSRIYGFPCVPEFGPWNHGFGREALCQKSAEIPECDVLLAHCPPYGFLDMCPSGHIGNPYLLQNDWQPKLVLCGHVHESGGGQVQEYDTLIMNNATTMRLFELP